MKTVTIKFNIADKNQELMTQEFFEERVLPELKHVLSHHPVGGPSHTIKVTNPKMTVK